MERSPPDTRPDRPSGNDSSGNESSGNESSVNGAPGNEPSGNGAPETSPPAGPDAVLLTGATGFLGGFVCAELLRQTRATVYCLVRGRSLDGAQARLARHLSARRVPGPERVQVVHGDLTKTRLGLAPEQFEMLREAVGAVYHCAASLNYAASYDQLVPANVRGTSEVLRFARHGRPKAFHHVSTVGVFIAGRSCGMLEVSEATFPTEASAGVTGYHRTKVVAEHAVRHAANLGLEATIYRPGMALADSATGLSSEHGAAVLLMKAAIAVRRAPRTVSGMYVGAADHLAKAIVALSLSPSAGGRVFHVARPGLFLTADFLSHARSYGYELQDVSIPDWWSALADGMADPAAFTALALKKVADYVLLPDPLSRIPHVHTEDTSAVLASLGVTAPDLDTDYFEREFRYLIENRILPPPPGRRERL